MKMDASQPLALLDGNNAFNIEQEPRQTNEYFKDFVQSFHGIYLKHKWFDEKCK